MTDSGAIRTSKITLFSATLQVKPVSFANEHVLSLSAPMITRFRTEISWYMGALITGLIVGLIAGWPILGMLLFSVGYGAWLLVRMANIVKWLESGAASSKAPPTMGMMNQVVGLIHREKAYSRKQKNRYRVTLARFNSLAAELPDATVVYDGQRIIQWSNTAAGSLLNIHDERDQGQRIDNLLRSPEMLQFLSQPEQGVEEELASPVTPEKTLSLIKVKAGKGMTVIIARDITQRVKVREMRKAFVADVSHELRTPLTVIRGYLEMILEKPQQLDDKTRNALTNVQTQSDRMHHIVEHLLELSKLEGNPLGELEGEPIMVASVLENIVESLRKTIGQAHQFEIGADKALLLLGSEREIYSACSNLISNAVKYTEAGTTISITWQRNKDGQPNLCVSDDGAGIEALHLHRLSERFYRVDKGRSRESGGTGLGLAIVKHVSQRHGGQLHIDSTPGQGSTFLIEFPNSRIANMPKVSSL